MLNYYYSTAVLGQNLLKLSYTLQVNEVPKDAKPLDTLLLRYAHYKIIEFWYIFI